MIVSVPGAELHYTTQGRGPTCLVPTAIGTRPYEKQMARLAERLRLVHVDLRGSGRSTGAPADLTLDVLADDLEAIRGSLGLDRVAVLGHSILGALALEYGRRCAASVSHVIAVGAPPSGDMGRLMAKATAFFQAEASEERKRLLAENLARLPPGASPADTVLAQSPLRFYDARFDAAPLFAEAESRPAFMAHLMVTLLGGWDVRQGADLRVPIFLALGRHDYVVPHVLWNDVAPSLPTLTRLIFERSGHQPFFEEPERFVETVLTWMSA